MKKGKQKVLGKSRKIKAKSGQIGGVMIRLRSNRVKSALGKRAQIPATMRFQLDRVRKGKKVGQVKKKVRFKLKR